MGRYADFATEQVELQLFVYRPNRGQPNSVTIGLTLQRDLNSGKVTVLLYNELDAYSGKCYGTLDTSRVDMQFAKNLPVDLQRKMRFSLRQFALRKGLLFEPPGPLTRHEQEHKGYPHCSHCDKEVSFRQRSLGCTQCGMYVCPDGYCLCGESWLTNYLGQKMPPRENLKCGWGIRRAAVKIARNISKMGDVIGHY